MSEHHPLPEPIAAEVEKRYTSFAKNEPAVLTGLIAGPVGGALVGLSQAGILSGAQASTLSATITGVLVTLGIAAQSFVVRKFVTPWWKRTTGRVFPPGDSPDDGS